MKTYCTQCGSANDYMGAKPSKCKTCGYSMGAKKITEQERNYREIRKIVAEEFDPEFSNSSTPDIEPFTEAELESIKVSNAKQIFNLKDVMKGETKKKPSRRKKRNVEKR